MKTEQIIVHVKPEIKADAMAIFEKIGISASEAVNLFLTQVVMAKCIPSDMYIPNQETLRAFQDSDSGRNMKKCETLDELYKDLNIYICRLSVI